MNDLWTETKPKKIKEPENEEAKELEPEESFTEVYEYGGEVYLEKQSSLN